MPNNYNHIPSFDVQMNNIAKQNDAIPPHKEVSAPVQHADNYTEDKTRPFEAKQSATDISRHPVFQESAKIEHALKEKNELDSIKDILNSGDLKNIHDFLQDEKIRNLTFHKEILRVKAKYEKELSSADFLTPKDWRILTAIEIFDKNTFEHSIGTYIVAKDKIENRLPELGMEIRREGVAIETFFRSCILHDVGKIGIPEFILNNRMTDHEWVYYLMELPMQHQNDALIRNDMLPESYFNELSDEEKAELKKGKYIIIPDAIRKDSSKITAFFEENRIRAVNVVPIKAVLNEKQIEILKRYKLDPDDSLKTIMSLHEQNSKDFLTMFGYTTEAFLAGTHHTFNNADNEPDDKGVSSTTLHISKKISSYIIHFADLQHALNGDRSYHFKQPILRIMAFIVDDVKNGKVKKPDIAARWINDELKKISPAYLKEILNLTATHQHPDYLRKRNAELLIIDDFLNDELPSGEALYNE